MRPNKPRVPGYRPHSRGQARVTLEGRDYLLGPFGSDESKEAYRLPLVRRLPGKAEECGLLCDLEKLAGLQGQPFTVFLGNLVLLPDGLDAFLALPREAYASAEEVYAAGWRVD
jgi:hypothetical protein